MKKTTAFLLVLICIAAICGSCASKTPDVIESEEKAAITIDTLDWSLEVEGGNVDTYTLADAKKHEISKMITSALKSSDDPNYQAGWISFRVDGICLYEFLEDVGRSDATKVTCYGTDVYGKDTAIVLEGDLLTTKDVKIGWIMNITDVLIDTTSYVGIFGSTSVTEFTSCNCITKIVIE